MNILGAVICELMGDPNWTNRLDEKASKYENASKVQGLSRGTSENLTLMGNRARILAAKNRIHEGRRDMGMVSGGPESLKLTRMYNERTDRLYPERVSRRAENERSAANSMLPKSLQK